MKFPHDYDPRGNDLVRVAHDFQWVPVTESNIGSLTSYVYRISTTIAGHDHTLYIGHSTRGPGRLFSHVTWRRQLERFAGVELRASVTAKSMAGIMDEKDAYAHELEAHALFTPVLESEVSRKLFTDNRRRIGVVAAMLKWNAQADRDEDRCFVPVFCGSVSFSLRRGLITIAEQALPDDIERALWMCSNPNGGLKPNGYAREPQNWRERGRVAAALAELDKKGNDVGREST